MSRIRFRLSTLFILVAVVTAGCWWYTNVRPRWLANSALQELDRLQSQKKTGQLAWGAEMKELVEIGPIALPVLVQALDATPSEDRLNLRTIPFAMRCMEDPRAVPALIRAIPRCFGNDGSDMGYSLSDPELAKFFNERHEDARSSGFSYGRPVNEVFGALKRLTGQEFDHMELAFVTRRDFDTARQTQLKLELYEESADRWARWWEANWKDFTSDRQFAKVGLPSDRNKVLTNQKESLIDDEVDRVFERSYQGFVVQPVCIQSNRLCFLDLDTNRWAILPERFGNIDSPVEFLPKELFEWASKEGFDLYGATLRKNGKEHYIVKSIDTQVFEVDILQETRSLTLEFVKENGRKISDVVAHWDTETNEAALEATGDFVFITRENTVGHLELGVEVKSISPQDGPVRRDRNRRTSGRRLGRRIGISYLVPEH